MTLADVPYRLSRYVIYSFGTLYLMAALTLLNVSLVGRSPEEVLLAAIRSIGPASEQIAPQDDAFGGLGSLTPSYDMWVLDSLKSAPEHDPHVFDPLDWDKLRRPISR